MYGADTSETWSFRGREKQDVFLAAPMDGFTAVPERPCFDRGCALHINNVRYLQRRMHWVEHRPQQVLARQHPVTAEHELAIALEQLISVLAVVAWDVVPRHRRVAMMDDVQIFIKEKH